MSSDNQQIASGPIAWMAQHPVAPNLLMVIFLIGGVILARQVKQEVFPEFTTDVIRISVPYPGASPEEVEQGIVLVVEDGVRGLEGVKEVTATAYEGVGTVVVEVLTSADPFKVFQDVKNEVDRITSFPEDAENPVVSLVESKRRVVTLAVYGEQQPRELRELAERVRDDLVQRPGVTYVELGLAPAPEIALEVSQDTLRAYNLTLEQIADEIRRSALELPGGEVRTKSGQILLRTQERRDYGSEFFDVPIAANEDGSIITVGDVAEISDGFAESDQEARFSGKPAILVEVYRVGDETPQSVSKAVRDYIAELSLELPDGAGVSVWEDRSTIFKSRMRLLFKNGFIGLALVLILLGIFLEPRLAFWVTLGIPISILGCFLFVPFTGASINMISLFAFIVTLGIVVDDAVIMGENIYDKRQAGLPALQAAIVGAREMAMPVMFAVLTNIAAFVPLLLIPGTSGKFFRQIPSVTIAVFIVSLIESLFILPAHLSHQPRQTKFWDTLNIPRKKFAVMLNNHIHKHYAPAVNYLVRYRYVTFSVAIAMLLVAVGLVRGGYIRFSFLPRIDSDLITAQAELPVGVPIEESRRVQILLEEAAKRTLEKNGGMEIAKGIYSQIGGALIAFAPGPPPSASGGGHLVATQVSLIESGLRDISGTDFARAWRKEVGRVLGLKSLLFKAETGASEGSAIDFRLSHRNRELLEQAARELREVLETYSGVFDTDDGVATGKRQLSFRLRPEARTLGITARDLGRQVRASFYGAEALRQQRGRNEVKVMVRLPKVERETLSTLENLIIRTPSGGEVPLSVAAEVEEGRSYKQINREDGRRVISVVADVDDEVSNSNLIIENVVENDLPPLMRKYPGLTYSFGGERQAQSETMRALGIGFGIMLLVIFALLAIPFGSYLQPIIVMLSIPFGIIGAVGGHFLLGYNLSIISMFGIVALSGVVVNDSLVLVVTANRLREEGVSAREAIQQAGIRRFRPILLTSLTTFFGLAPIIFETSVQARFLIPMAISLGFGILFATLIVLGLVPAVYMILEDVKARVGRKRLVV